MGLGSRRAEEPTRMRDEEALGLEGICPPFPFYLLGKKILCSWMKTQYPHGYR